MTELLDTLLTGAATLVGLGALVLAVALIDAALCRLWRRWQYTRYLRSDAWQAKRLVALSAASYRCARCGSRNRLEVHHRHYRTFKRERPSDLEVLCRSCHKRADAERRGAALLIVAVLALVGARQPAYANEAEPATCAAYLALQGTRTYQEYNGEWRTAYDYRTGGDPVVALRIWSDAAPGLYNIAGWPEGWRRDVDCIQLAPARLPAEGRIFTAVFSGLTATDYVVWDAGPATPGGLVRSARRAPRGLPQTGAYLPLVGR